MRILIVMALLLLAGCIQIGDKPQPQNHYLLQAGLAPVETEETSTRELTINIETLELATFIDKPNIAFKQNDNLISYLQSERWAEPLDSNMSRIIRTNLLTIFPNATITIGPWEKRGEREITVRLSIDDFSSHSTSTAGMTAYYQLRYNGKIYNKVYHRIVATGTSVADQVKGLNQILDQFCSVLAQEIRTLPR